MARKITTQVQMDLFGTVPAAVQAPLLTLDAAPLTVDRAALAAEEARIARDYQNAAAQCRADLGQVLGFIDTCCIEHETASLASTVRGLRTYGADPLIVAEAEAERSAHEAATYSTFFMAGDVVRYAGKEWQVLDYVRAESAVKLSAPGRNETATAPASQCSYCYNTRPLLDIVSAS